MSWSLVILTLVFTFKQSFTLIFVLEINNCYSDVPKNGQCVLSTLHKVCRTALKLTQIIAV